MMDALDRELEALYRNPDSFPKTPEEIVQLPLLFFTEGIAANIDSPSVIQDLAAAIEHAVVHATRRNPERRSTVLMRLPPEFSTLPISLKRELISNLVVVTGFAMHLTNSVELAIEYIPHRAASS